MMLMPGRRSRAGGENSSPRSILINVASTSESTINATVEMAWTTVKTKIATEAIHRIDPAVSISDDPERREGQCAFDRPR